MANVDLPTAATVIDVSPRDGLQNESRIVSTRDKLHLIEGLVAAGVTNIEATSFVHPDVVPAMADADVLMREVPRIDGVRYIGLVLNDRGLERALTAEVDEVNVAVVTTDTFSRRNQNVDTAEGISAAGRIAATAAEAGVDVSVTVAAAFGGPYEGEVPVSRLVDVVRETVNGGEYVRVSIADTIGAGTPRDVVERYGAIADLVPDGVALGSHFHNTRNTGYANAYAALMMGVTHFDASAGGIGGCPFAPNATGNIGTEDLVHMFERMGVRTGFDLDRLIETSRWLEGPLGTAVPGLIAKAGVFPGDPQT